MTNALLFSIGALAGLLPVTILSLKSGQAKPTSLFWLLFAVAFAGAASYAVSANLGGWDPGLATTLWVSIAASLAVFAIAAVAKPVAWRLARVMLPYLVVLGVLASVWSGAGERTVSAPSGGWLALHIALAVLTFALATNAAVAAVAVLLRERALKHKGREALSQSLPSVADAEFIETRMLSIAAGVLFVGMVSGMAELYVTQGLLIVFNHKTVFALSAFLVIVLLLYLRAKSGLRGRRAARLLLLAYLLITLAYPGVKFVTDVILA